MSAGMGCVEHPVGRLLTRTIVTCGECDALIEDYAGMCFCHGDQRFAKAQRRHERPSGISYSVIYCTCRVGQAAYLIDNQPLAADDDEDDND